MQALHYLHLKSLEAAKNSLFSLQSLLEFTTIFIDYSNAEYKRSRNPKTLT